MRYNQLGKTGLFVSELCLGTMTFGGKGYWKAMGELGEGDANEIVAKALDAGINFFDTANVYSEGESERLLGQALGSRRKDVVVATKVFGQVGAGPNDKGLSRGHIMRAVEDSLQRLGTDYIDLYQIHGYDSLTPIDETLRALDDLVTSGKVRYIGCSNQAAWQLMKALGRSELNGWARFESLQAYYSIAGRDLERELSPLLLDQDLGLLVWSPLAGGFLTGKFKRDQEKGPQEARRSNFDFPPVERDRAFAILDVLENLAESHQASVAQLALGWLLHQKTVTSVILGVKTTTQLADNLGAIGVNFSAQELDYLNKVSALPAEYPGWMLERQGNGRVAGLNPRA
jgi:aryl-alcohol dehydrogenase-like predicted oxidoreductase